MFLRRAFVESRRSASRLFAHAYSSRAPPIPSIASHLSEYLENASQSSPTEPNTLQDAVGRFCSTVTTSPDDSHRASYNALVSTIDSLKTATSELSEPYRGKLRDALIYLAQYHRDEDPDIVPDVLRLVARLLGTGLDQSAEDVFSKLILADDLTSAYRWLGVCAKLRDDLPVAKQSLWNRLLKVAAQRRDKEMLEHIMELFKQLHVRPTEYTSRAMFTGLFDDLSAASIYHPPPFPTVKDWINVAASYGIHYDTPTVQIIVDGYARAGMDDLATMAEYVYTVTLAAPGCVPHERFNRVLAYMAQHKTRAALNQAVAKFMRVGLKPSENTLLAVMGDTTHISDLSHWQRILRKKATPAVISRLMARRAQTHASVLEVYQYAQAHKVPLTGSMLHHAIESVLTTRGPEGPTEKAVDQALALYHHFVARLGGEQDSRQGDQTNHQQKEASAAVPRRQHMYPKEPTYEVLLRALHSAGNVVKYLPVALSLVEDMARFQITLDSKSATSVILLLMTSSSDPEEAFSMYRLIASRPNQPPLKEAGYSAILDTFCKLPTWPQGIPSTALYFEILGDMHKHNVPLGPKVYTVLLAQLAKLATVAAGEADLATRSTIAQTVARVHNHLTVRPAFAPDTALWNQLMDAYQRAGCFAEAWRVWQSLLAAGQINAASVSVILDACAYARAYDMAVSVYHTLHERAFPMNVRNWNTYLECLCRLGRLDEALKVLCLEMTARGDGVQPDKESVRVLLKFAAKLDREWEVRSHIKRFLPKLYYLYVAEK
ncbi:hypothetical protein BD413DRAFT_704848 [Trametes elegans]|nr:hypothetical protein BD413DRAFT_704848 [Trametes elegans]